MVCNYGEIMNIDIFKKTIFGKINLIYAIFLTIAICAAGCQTAESKRIVKPEKIINQGDKVLVDFTCRLKKDKKIVVTTDESLIKENEAAKSSIFYPLKEYAPIPVTAGEGDKELDHLPLKPTHKEILENISMAIVGKAEGAPIAFDIAAEYSQGAPDDIRYSKISRIRRKPRIQKISRVFWEKRHGKTPSPGDVIENYQNIEGITATVLSIDDKEVEVKFNIKDGTVVYAPIGKVLTYEEGDNIKSVIDYKPGQLIRSGGIIGRAIEVTDTMITFDYGHPFGGEVLSCEAIARRDEAVDEKK
jgi:FKBP-type peptidyl-prolyl cis-trans isomerase 2